MADIPGENPSEANAPPQQQQQQQPSDNAGGGNSHPPPNSNPPPSTAQPVAASPWIVIEPANGLHVLVHPVGCAECERYHLHLGEHHVAGSPQYVQALDTLKYHWAKSSFLHEYTQREGMRFVERERQVAVSRIADVRAETAGRIAQLEVENEELANENQHLMLESASDRAEAARFRRERDMARRQLDELE